ncbi:serine-threonine kinase receptor-associated protein-like [Artemia franciscana]|uniref:serine-threonine kinase receptor-associated protein-like n=1 Tax=Artemia franciscana TaxID=6661 RepID=UPI0032DBAC79
MLRQTPLTCSGHTRPVVDLAFSKVRNNEYFLISACKDGKPMLRQGHTGDWIGTYEGHKGAVWGVSLNADATRAATGAADLCAKVWNASTGEELQSFNHPHIVKTVSFSPEGTELATGGVDKVIRVFDLNKTDATPVCTIESHTGTVKRVCFLKHSQLVLSCSDDSTIRVHDRRCDMAVTKREFTAMVEDIEVSVDEKHVTVAEGKHVSFFDTERFEKVKEVTFTTRIHSASLEPDNTYFVCGGEDFKIYKYDFANCTELESYKGHFGPVHCVRYSPDGEIYASGSEDGTLRLWQSHIGKSYGLWKAVEGMEKPDAQKAEAAVI